MKAHRTHYANVRRRQTKRSRRSPLLFIGLLTVILILLYSYAFTPFGKDPLQSSAETISSQSKLAKDAQLAWPKSGQAAVGSVEDGLLARSSDQETPRPIASMAKVITALAVMEKLPFKPGQTGKTYTLTSKDVANYLAYAAKNGSVQPVHAGLVLTQYQAMQMMLIASDNNMADMLAERTFGGAQAYTLYAQGMVQRMGLNQTTVADASGFSPATASTPSELVTMGIAALKNPIIAEIVAQSHAQIPGVGTIKNTNELLDTDGAGGIKTGTTDQAGSCLLFAASYNNKDGQKETIVGVIMGQTNAATLFSNSRNLLASTRQGLGLIETQPTGDVATPPPMQTRDQAP